MSETFAIKFSSVYLTGNFSFPAPHQAFYGNYGSVCRRLSTLDVEGSMGPDGFHPKLLSS